MNCIFICIFHNPNYVYLCQLLLQSIHSFGNITSEHILIYTTDSLKYEIEKIVPSGLNVYYEVNNKIETKEEACHARIDFFTLPTVIHNRYEKVMYLDTDILVLNPIQPLFDLITEPLVYALEEGILEKDTIVKHGGYDYWGVSLFGMAFPQYERRSAFSSGILLFPNMPIIKFLFQKIKSLALSVSNPYLHGFDQPYIVYCCMILEIYDNQKLKKYAAYSYPFEKIESEQGVHLILNHFAGGVGVHGHKLIAMQAFYKNMCNKNNIIYKDIISVTNPTKIITNENTIVITTTLSNNKISEKRRKNMIDSFSEYRIPVLYNHGITKTDKITFTELSCQITIDSLQIYKKTTYPYAIICDDDFYPCPHFLEELNKTVELLPDNWNTLHLCPGYLWGRANRNMAVISKHMPEYNMEGIPYHSSGRFYNNIDSNYYMKRHFWLGGPVAFLIRLSCIDEYLDKFTENSIKINSPNDVILTKILTSHDFICREPQLGMEIECGGTTIKN